MSATAGTDGTSAQGDGAPAGGNVSDGTQQVPTPATTNVTNDDSTSTPASTRSDDTRGQGFDIAKLLDRLDALPESIANAVKEAAPVAPVTTPTPVNTSTNAVDSGTGTGATGESGATNEPAKLSRQQRFVKSWFGQ